MIRTALVLTAGFALASAPLAALAADAPISVTMSEAVSADASMSGDTTQQGHVTLTFVNHRASPATSVTFAVVGDGQQVAVLEAAGKFSQGISVKHSYATFGTQMHQMVKVVSATFADGAVWANGQLMMAAPSGGVFMQMMNGGK